MHIVKLMLRVSLELVELIEYYLIYLTLYKMMKSFHFKSTLTRYIYIYIYRVSPTFSNSKNGNIVHRTKSSLCVH